MQEDLKSQNSQSCVGSQVTLQDFHSQFSQQEQLWQEALKKYSLEDRRHLIIDKTNKKIIDCRNQQIVENLFKKSPKICYQEEYINGYSSKNELLNVWDDHWQQSDKIHQKMLSSICTNDFETFSDLINNRSSSHPINVNFKSFDEWAAIHYLAMHGRVTMLKIFLKQPDLNINALTKFHWNALHVAVNSNKLETCQILIDNKIQLNKKDRQQNTPLHYAAELGYKDIIKILIDNKCDREIVNSKGYLAKQLCRARDLLQLFDQQKQDKQEEQKGGFFSNFLRNNKIQMIQRLMNKQQQRFLPNQENKLVKKKPNQISNRQSKIIKMYELLRTSKVNAQTISLSSFKFYKKIGEGAFGQVYIVKKGKSEKTYALKAIKKQKVLKTNLYKYIQTQKQVLSLISHPFIVKLHYAFQTQTYLFLVMEYCEGGDLGKLLERKKKLDQATTKAYACEILLALQALHKNMIIYRDLKPENIVIDRDGHALLTDFGLSKKTHDLDQIQKSFCGTPAYLPLEIIDKKGHTRMADWYQYGVVLYQMMVGIPPFYADTRSQLFKNIRQGIIKFPKNTPQKFKDIIKKLLHQDMHKRLGYQNDAQSIKQHPWFSDIDWNDVYERKLKVPPIQKKVVLSSQPIKCKYQDIKNQKLQVPSWSFIIS